MYNGDTEPDTEIGERVTMNREVNITKRVQTSNGPRYCPVVLAANGRVKPNVVLVNGKPEHHTEGAYYLEWREGAKRVRLSVGNNSADAAARRQRKEAELNAVNHGAALAPEPSTGRSVRVAVTAYLEDVKLKNTTNKPKNFGRHNTHGVYSTALAYFLESCHKLNLEDIDRRDLLKYAAFLQTDKDQGPRSVHGKFGIVISFLKAQGIRGLVNKNDWPRYTEEEPEIYEQEELDALFAACDAEERLWFEFFLMTGMREQEVIFCCWPDVNFTASTVRVSHKPAMGWSPKTYKEREIPIPQRLTARLKAAKAQAGTCKLVFATSGCKPKHDFLDCLKAIVERTKLDPDDFRLHKFRATFATRCLWAGVDLRTVQLWMGHSDIESTMRYLKPSRSQSTRDKVNEIFAPTVPEAI
jgi:integrase/recombinase XerD